MRTISDPAHRAEGVYRTEQGKESLTWHSGGSGWHSSDVVPTGCWERAERGDVPSDGDHHQPGVCPVCPGQPRSPTCPSHSSTAPCRAPKRFTSYIQKQESLTHHCNAATSGLEGSSGVAARSNATQQIRTGSEGESHIHLKLQGEFRETEGNYPVWDAGRGAHANQTQGHILHHLGAKPIRVCTTRGAQDLPLGALQGRGAANTSGPHTQS